AASRRMVRAPCRRIRSLVSLPADLRWQPACSMLRASSLSIAVELGHAIRVKAGIAEHLVEDAVALHVKAHIMLVGHAHAAMHLNALLHRAARRRARLALRHGDHQRRGGIAGVEEML